MCHPNYFQGGHLKKIEKVIRFSIPGPRFLDQSPVESQSFSHLDKNSDPGGHTKTATNSKRHKSCSTADCGRPWSNWAWNHWSWKIRTQHVFKQRVFVEHDSWYEWYIISYVLYWYKLTNNPYSLKHQRIPQHRHPELTCGIIGRQRRNDRMQNLVKHASTGKPPLFLSDDISISAYISYIQRKFRNLTSDYTESCCWRSVNQQMWSRRCDIAEMWDMRIWRVGSARNAVFYHSFVASPARKVRS